MYNTSETSKPNAAATAAAAGDSLYGKQCIHVRTSLQASQIGLQPSAKVHDYGENQHPANGNAKNKPS